MNVVNVEQKQLLTKIEAFSFDQPGTNFAFSQRLAKENGWDIEYLRSCTILINPSAIEIAA